MEKEVRVTVATTSRLTVGNWTLDIQPETTYMILRNRDQTMLIPRTMVAEICGLLQAGEEVARDTK